MPCGLDLRLIYRLCSWKWLPPNRLGCAYRSQYPWRIERAVKSVMSDPPSGFPRPVRRPNGVASCYALCAGIILRTNLQMRAFSPDAIDALLASPHLPLQAQFPVPDL